MAQNIMPREIRMIGIRGFSKEHLASCDEFGERGHKTLGGVDYDPIHRTGNRPVEKALSGIAWKSRLDLGDTEDAEANCVHPAAWWV